MSVSLPPQTFRSPRDNATQLFRRHDAPTMTWADIEAERMARGLDLPPAPRAICRASHPTFKGTTCELYADHEGSHLSGACMWVRAAVIAPPASPVITPSKAKRAAKSTGPRMVDGQDARLPSNLSRCTAPAAAAKPTTAAQAASMRRKAMATCSCRLCNLALYPAQTFVEHAAFMGGDLQAEHWLATHQGERKLTTHDPDRETLNAYRATVAREAAHGTIFTPGWKGGTGREYMDAPTPFIEDTFKR